MRDILTRRPAEDRAPEEDQEEHSNEYEQRSRKICFVVIPVFKVAGSTVFHNWTFWPALAKAFSLMRMSSPHRSSQREPVTVISQN